MEEEQDNKRDIPNWRFYLTPVYMYISAILVFWFFVGKQGDGIMSLLIGLAAGFVFIVLWIIQTYISTKSPSSKYKVSVKKLVLMGVYSFIFFIACLIIIILIFN
ncbi:MAG: hypothetical protein ACNFW9_04520 [Candidatus Kerfeldbacteria bacterium]